MQYLLGKDKTSPVKVEVDAPQQHSDAVGIWRKITYTYEDGCQIVLEGEGFESKGKTAFIEGPKGKVFRGFECTIPDVMNKLAELPDPEPQRTDFLECVRTRQKFALNEENGHRSCTLVNLGAVALRLRPREPGIRQRRRCQCAHLSAHARPVASLIKFINQYKE